MKKKKGPKDPESVAAMEEIVAMEQKQEQLADLNLKKREAAIAMTFELAGKVKAMRYNERQSGFFKLLLMKQAKEAKEYREQHGMTWEQFCEYCGENRRWIDEQLVKLKDLKVEFLEAFLRFSDFDFHKIKYLGEAVTGGLLRISGNSIVYEGEEIPVVTERADDVKALFEKLEVDYRTKLDDAQGDARASKRVLKDKEALINKQAKLIDQYTGKARSKDLTPEEDGFLQQMENLKRGFDGYMLKVEPDKVKGLQSFAAPRDENDLHPPTTVTPRMRSAYMEALGYMLRQLAAAYDTADELFGYDLKTKRPEWASKLKQ